MDTWKRALLDSTAVSSQRLKAQRSQSILLKDKKYLKELQRKEEHADAVMEDTYEYTKFKDDSKNLLVSVQDHSHNQSDSDDSLGTSESIREYRAEKEMRKKREKEKARKLMKLSSALVDDIKNKKTVREDWEKNWSVRHNKRYWKHKDTGITRWDRPYVNEALEHEDDDTDVSIYGDGSDSDTSSSSSGSSSSSSSSSEGSSDYSDIYTSDGTLTVESKELYFAEVAARRKKKAKRKDKEQVKKRKEKEKRKAGHQERVDARHHKRAEKAQAMLLVDRGVWIEKYNRRYDTKYWRNPDTNVLMWDKPPIGGVSPVKRGGVYKVPVTEYVYLKDESYIETRAEMRDRIDREWKEKWSIEYEMSYYKNVITKEIRWEHPAEELDAMFRLGADAETKDDLSPDEVKEARRRSVGGEPGADRKQSMKFLKGYDSDDFSESIASPQSKGTTESGTKVSEEDTFQRVYRESGGVWKKKYNKRWQCSYYKNAITGDCQWDEPVVGESPSQATKRASMAWREPISPGGLPEGTPMASPGGSIHLGQPGTPVSPLSEPEVA
jgi:hypothetical protein